VKILHIQNIIIKIQIISTNSIKFCYFQTLILHIQNIIIKIQIISTNSIKFCYFQTFGQILYNLSFNIYKISLFKTQNTRVIRDLKKN